MTLALRFPGVLLLTLLILVATSCSDDSGPVETVDDATANLSVAVESEAWGTTAPFSHEGVRIVVHGDDGSELRRLTLNHSGSLDRTFGPFQVSSEGLEQAIDRVEVEVIGGSGPVRVLWSGVTQDLGLSADGTHTVQVSLYPSTLDQRALSSVSVTAPHLEIGVGEMWAFSASGSGAELSGGFWGTLDPSVARVDANGLVEGVGVGTARIVHASGLSADTVVVEVREPADEISLDPGALEFTYVREHRDVEAEVTDFRGDPMPDAEVLWTTSNPAVAGVDATGRVVARGGGTATVTATAGGSSAAIPVSVTQEPAELLVLPFRAVVQLGQSLQLNASVRDSGGTRIEGVSIAYSIGDESSATVSESGRIQGHALGETRLLVEGAGLSTELDVEVVAGSPVRVQLVSGGGQSGPVDEELPQPVRVRVIDGSGFPVPDTEVVWSASDDGSATAAGAATTDADGEVAATWTLGIGGVGTQTLTVYADGASPLEVTANATAGPPVQLVKVSGDQQNGTVAEAVGEPLIVQLQDAFGFPVPGVAVHWDASGSGSASPDPTVLTDADGHAATDWVLGSVAGSQHMDASVDPDACEIQPMRFHATAVAGPAAQVVITPSTLELEADQESTLSASVQDAYGNPVSGTSVSWSSDAPLTAAVSPSTGTVTAVWEGAATITASAAGVFGTAPVTVAPLISNGSFEDNGGVGTKSFADWVTTDSGDPNRGWFVQSGTMRPLGGVTVPEPFDGTYASMSDQGGPGVSFLYRTVRIPEAAETLEFELFYSNQPGVFYSPESFAFGTDPNQQFRVDLTDPASAVDALGASVLMTLFRTVPGDDLVTASGYITVSADVTALQGQSVRLRFGQVDNQGVFLVGVDQVRFGRSP